MAPDKIELAPITHRHRTEAAERWRVFWVFVESCLQRETLKFWIYPSLLMPLIVAGYFTWQELTFVSYQRQGRALFQSLTSISVFFVFVGGVRLASKAVCWEVSRELRDLVRLTGIEPSTLLWCQTICRWWIVGFSVMFLLPLAMFARTLGGVSSDHWIAAACWLVLVAVLTVGFGMFASVSSGRVQNAETNAAMTTFVLMVLYHVAIWGSAALIGLIYWCFSNQFFPPPRSIGRTAFEFLLGLSPITGLYRATTAPDTFTPFEPAYWLHLITGFCFMQMSAIVMKRRFRVTTQGDQDALEPVSNPAESPRPALLRPRCRERPFFWKDVYILGDGAIAQSWWTFISWGAVIGVFAALAYGIPIVAAVIGVCLFPIFLAVRFDALMAAEFREQTWGGLMVLPIDPRKPVLSKIQAAAWERRSFAIPAGLAALIGGFTDPALIVEVAAIACISAIVIIEVSVLNWFNTKLWWYGSVVGLSIVILIIGIILVWASFIPWVSLTMTLGTLSGLATCLYWKIHWRLRNWTDD